MTRVRRAILAAAVLALAAPALGAKFYKWVDDEGVTHYDSKPPAGQTASEEVRTRHSASSDQDEAIKRLEQRRATEADAAQRRQQQRQDRDNPAGASEESCAQYRQNLEILINKPVVRVKNPDTGEMEVIGQDRRDQLLKEARAAVEFCQARSKR